MMNDFMWGVVVGSLTAVILEDILGPSIRGLVG